MLKIGLHDKGWARECLDTFQAIIYLELLNEVKNYEYRNMDPMGI